MVSVLNLDNQIYDKRDDFNFPVVNCPFLDSNIPSSPACRGWFDIREPVIHIAIFYICHVNEEASQSSFHRN